MRPAHRKIHRGIWVLLAIGLPILFYLALSGIPATSTTEAEPIQAPRTAPKGQQLAEDEVCRATYFPPRDSYSGLLQFDLFQPLESPSVVIRIAGTPPLDLGMLETNRTYLLTLPEGVDPKGSTIELFDPAKGIIWHQIELTQ